jgi:hypothetical protein
MSTGFTSNTSFDLTRTLAASSLTNARASLAEFVWAFLLVGFGRFPVAIGFSLLVLEPVGRGPNWRCWPFLHSSGKKD